MPNSKKSIIVSAEWGYELHNCPLSIIAWRRILKGQIVRRVVPFFYEGEKYKGDWLFNYGEFGSLTVTYGDGGVGFIGRIDETLIFESGTEITWEQSIAKHIVQKLEGEC